MLKANSYPARAAQASTPISRLHRLRNRWLPPLSSSRPSIATRAVHSPKPYDYWGPAHAPRATKARPESLQKGRQHKNAFSHPDGWGLPARGGHSTRRCGSIKAEATSGLLPQLKAAWLTYAKWPLEKMSIGQVSTAWTFQDGWIIAAYVLLIRPLLIISYSVCSAITTPTPSHPVSVPATGSDQDPKGEEAGAPTWKDRLKAATWNPEGYSSSWAATLYRPLLLLSVPIAANYLKDIFLNILFTFKLVKKAQLLNIATMGTEISKLTFLAWAAYSAFFLKDRFIGPIFTKTKAGRRIMPAISKLLSIAVLAVLAVGALKLFGLDKESLGLAGITAAVTATAGQSFLKQFLASLFMSSPESAVQVGDVIAVAGVLGCVTKIGWMKTTIAMPEGMSVYINNETLLKEKVTSITRSSYRRMDEVFGVIGADPRRVFHAVDDLRAWIKTSGLAHKDMPVQVHVYGAEKGVLKLRLEVPFADTNGRDPWARQRELDGRHAVMKAAVDILSKHQCVMWELKGSAPSQIPTQLQGSEQQQQQQQQL